MVLPLLGLLGLGAAAGIKPHYDNYSQGVMQRGQGRRNQGMIAGVDPNDPMAMGSALFGGGAITGQQYQQDLRGAYEGQQQRQNALQRSRISAGPAHARLAWEKRKHNAQETAITDAMKAAGLPPTMWNVPGARQGYENAVQGQIEQEYGPEWDPTRDPAFQRQLALNTATQTRRAEDAEAARQAGILEDDRNRALDLEERINAEQRASSAASQTALVDSTNEFIPEAQKSEDLITTTEWAIENLENASFDSPFWSDTEGLKTANTINKMLEAQKQAAWSAERSDAPSEKEMEQLNALYPKIEPGVRDEARAAVIMQNLRQWLNQLTQGAQMRREAFSRTTGRDAPLVTPGVQLPAGWR